MPATTAPPSPRAPATPDRPDPSFWGDERRPRATRIPRPRADGIDALRDRVQAWRTDARAAVVVLVVVAVVAGVLWYRIGASGGDPPPRTRTASTTTAARADTAAGSTPTTGSRGATVIVHVAGAVTRPGVLELAKGARVIDAVEGAGGALPEAHLDQLNLAAKIADGQRVYVPRVGEPTLTPADGSASPADAGGSEGGPLNLNTATQAQLEELPGIGPVLASAVIDERERRGGFRSVNELRDVRGIGEKRFQDLRDRVTV